MKKLYDLILYDRHVKTFVIKLFTSNTIRNNNIYQHYHNRKVLSIMKEYYRFPHCVKIENTNACNSKCIMCPHDKMKRKVGFMKRALFEKVVDESAKNGVEHISLHNFGEPTLDKDFSEKVKYAKKKGVPRISSNTNASFLTPEVSKALLEAGLDELYISLDAFSKETFESVRRNLNYNEVMKNVHALISLKRSNKKYKTKIILDFVEMNENKHETKKFLNYWKGKVDHVCISCLHNWGGQTKKTTGVHKTSVSESGAPCRLLWTDLVVDWNGNVPLCCQDTEETMILGNITNQSLKEIWHSEKLNSIRYKHMIGRFSDVHICANCKLNTFWWMF